MSITYRPLKYLAVILIVACNNDESQAPDPELCSDCESLELSITTTTSSCMKPAGTVTIDFNAEDSDKEYEAELRKDGFQIQDEGYFEYSQNGSRLQLKAYGLAPGDYSFGLWRPECCDIDCLKNNPVDWCTGIWDSYFFTISPEGNENISNLVSIINSSGINGHYYTSYSNVDTLTKDNRYGNFNFGITGVSLSQSNKLIFFAPEGINSDPFEDEYDLEFVYDSACAVYRFTWSPEFGIQFESDGNLKYPSIPFGTLDTARSIHVKMVDDFGNETSDSAVALITDRGEVADTYEYQETISVDDLLVINNEWTSATNLDDCGSQEFNFLVGYDASDMMYFIRYCCSDESCRNTSGIFEILSWI